MEPRNHHHSHLVLILLSVLVGAVLTAVVLSQTQDHKTVLSPAVAQQQPRQVVTQFEDVAERVLPAVVYISADLPQRVDPRQDEMRRRLEELFRDMPGAPQIPRGGGGDGQLQARPRAASGSGWIYDETGNIVTNAHVVRGATKITVQLHDRANDTREYPARIVGIDPRSELAVIKVDAGRRLPTIPLGDSTAARIASWVMAVGSPFQLQQTVTVGVVSARGRTIGAESQYFELGDLIQTDAPINPGNSGGPLVNLNGEVIGINVAIASPGAGDIGFNVGIGFAVPSNVAKNVVPQLIRNGRVARGWLGVTIKTVNDNLREHFGAPNGGVLVTQINPDAPAAKVLQANDVIVAVNGQPVTTAQELSSMIANSAPRTRVNMELLRDRQRMTVAVELGEMPARYAGLEEGAPAAPEMAAGPPLVVRNITPELAQARNLCRSRGVFVDEVGGDLGDRVMRGDVITKVGNTTVETVDQYRAAIKQAIDAKRKFVILTVERLGPDGQKLTDVVDIPLTQNGAAPQ